MDSILEHCELNDELNTSPAKNQDEPIETVKPVSIEPSNAKVDDSDAADSQDDAFMADISTKLENAENPSTDSAPDTNSKTNIKESNDINISFDEDIILPSVRHDPEIEQKQRDRIKKKELKSRKELEEEEREKMQ